MNSRRTYGKLDDQPLIDGDKSFRGVKSYPSASSLEEGYLAAAQNVRLDEKVVETRKGTDRRIYANVATDVHAAGRYANPNAAAIEDRVAIGLSSGAQLCDPEGQTSTSVPYQSGQVATGDAEFVESFGSLFLFRGRGASTPMRLPVETSPGPPPVFDTSQCTSTLGEYPLEYDGEDVSDGGLFKMPKASVIIQIRGPRLPQVLPFNLYAHADLGPIEERSKTFTFDANGQVNGGGETGHQFEDGELIKILGSPDGYDGLHTCKRVDANTICLTHAPLPTSLFDTSYAFPTTNGTHNFSAPFRKIKIINSWHPHISTGSEYTMLAAQVSSGALSNLKLQGTAAGDVWVGLGAGRGVDWEVLMLGASGQNAGVLVWSEEVELPSADFGVTTGNRMVIKEARDIVRFSDVLKPTSFNPYFNRVTVNQGTGDEITALLPVHEDALVVFKRNSIHLITSVGTIGNADHSGTVTELTRQMGCVAQKSVVQAGGLVFFLSDSGVYAMDAGVKGGAKVGTHAMHMQIVDDPLSKDIHDEIRDINFAAAGAVRAIFHDNRYYLAVPDLRNEDRLLAMGYTASEASSLKNTTGATRLLVYNASMAAWESVDQFGHGFVIEELVVIPYNGQDRLFIVTADMSILVHDERTDAVDHYGTGYNGIQIGVSCIAKTRAYDMNDGNLKRWLRASLSYRTLNTGTDYLRVSVTTKEPDESSDLTFDFTQSTPEEFLRRLPLRRRGHSMQLTFNNLVTGRWRLRECLMEATIAGRATKSYQ